MKEQLKIRPARPEDANQIVEWLNLSPHYDPDILKYKSLAVLCAYNGKAVSYLPVQKAMILESVASDPEADDLTKAQALRDLVKGAELLASASDMSEIYLLGTDENVKKIAKAHGFTELPWLIMRLKL